MAEKNGSSNTAIVAIIVLILIVLAILFFYDGFGLAKRSESTSRMTETPSTTIERSTETKTR